MTRPLSTDLRQRVIAAVEDPHEQVNGAGAGMLREAGIEVGTGLLAADAESLNAGFLKRHRTGLPFVRLKVAASLDGAVAMRNGESQWISGPAARDDVQRLRARAGAIVTGIGTVLADDPALTVRSEALADIGGSATLEWIINAPGFSDRPGPANRTWGEIFQVSLYADYAYGELNNPRVSEEPTVDYSGYGLGLQFNVPGTFYARFDVASPIGSREAINGRDPQYYFRMSYTF